MDQRPDKNPLAVFDEKAIELLVGRGAEKKARFLHLFVERSSALVNQISAARTSGDLPAMSSAAHQLKSSSASVGGHALSELAARIETLASSTGNDLPEALKELPPLYKRTCDEIQGALRRRD